MQKSLLFFLLIFYHSLQAQVPESKDIYSSALLNYYKFAPASIVVSDSSINREIASFDYLSLIDPGRKGKRYLFGKELDSSWLNFLTIANSEKTHLISSRIEVNKTPDFYVNLVPGDSIKKSTNGLGHEGFIKHFGVSDLVELSSILRLGDKAIVQLDRHCGSLCGEGVLLFLERQNNNWILVYIHEIWIS